MSFFALIILTICPHRIPTPGVSDCVATQSSHTRTHIRTYTYAHTRYTIIHLQTYTCTCIEYNMHTICTQYAHTQTHRTQNTRYNNMQHTEDNREHNRERDTENSTQNSAHNYRTYSFDLYHEFAYIKNNNTIELYTISKD